MDKRKLIHNALETIARQNIPDDASVFNLKSTHPVTGHSKHALRLSGRAVIIAIAAILLLATAVFATYKLFLDPGLQGVKDAGLGSSLNVTAQPTQLADVTPQGGSPLPATLVGSQQTLKGVSVTLEWVSLNNMRLVFGFSARGLQDGMSFDIPQVAFKGVTPGDYRGANLSLSEGPVVTGEFISFQLINDENLGGKLDLGIDLPLTQLENGQPVLKSSFHFDLKDVPTDGGLPGSYPQTYSTSVNGVGLSLEWMKITPGYTTAKLCYDLPAAGEDWQLQKVTFQVGGADYQLKGQPVNSDRTTLEGDANGQRCVAVGAPLGIRGDDKTIRLLVEEMSAANAVRKGPWDFSVQPPDRGPFPVLASATATATPAAALSTETIGDLTATLKWAYADANRLAMLIHFDGYRVGVGIGEIVMKDDNGANIMAGVGWGSTAEDPSTFLLTVQFENSAYASAKQINLHVDLPMFAPEQQDKPLATFHFDLSLPVYQAKTYMPEQVVTANGLEMHLLKVDMTPSYTNLTLCYQKPPQNDNNDWGFGRGVELQVGENKVALESMRLLYDTDYGGYVGKDTPPADLPTIAKGRCMLAGFPVGDLASPAAQTLTLTVPGLEKSMPEVVPDDQLQAALAKLKAEGIEMSVTSSSGSGGGGGGYTFTAKPDGMSDEEAYRKYIEALGNVYPGPWAFTVQLP
jgi:hypothetical protein